MQRSVCGGGGGGGGSLYNAGDIVTVIVNFCHGKVKEASLFVTFRRQLVRNYWGKNVFVFTCYLSGRCRRNM